MSEAESCRANPPACRVSQVPAREPGCVRGWPRVPSVGSSPKLHPLAPEAWAGGATPGGGCRCCTKRCRRRQDAFPPGSAWFARSGHRHLSWVLVTHALGQSYQKKAKPKDPSDSCPLQQLHESLLHDTTLFYQQILSIIMPFPVGLIPSSTA